MPKSPKNIEPVDEPLETPVEPRSLPTEPKKRLRIKPLDIVALVVFILIVTVLATTIISNLNLKHEVSSAKLVSDRVIADIAQQKAADARSVADKKFQSSHTNSELSDLFKPIADIYGKTTPVVISQNASNTGKDQKVTFVYEYDRLKVPFYIAVSMSKPADSNTWQLVGLSANSNLNSLAPSSN